ncbi:BA75_03451T0 [Komagataella pastoris]|uniref:BA75_03451T0 n=1 Tax=Komagataella pastoris TaxID=4922 RepID=A0A1B2JF86_PICPA|nr:BA75_03451T0 [Komagataella pastoris]
MAEKEKFLPGEIVLAKMAGYPKWPAIVIPEERAPKPVLDAKPKGRALILVKFLADTSFYWQGPGTLESLSKNLIESSLKTKKIKTKKQLAAAYERALEEPTIDEEVVIAEEGEGDDGKSEDIDEDEEEDETGYSLEELGNENHDESDDTEENKKPRHSASKQSKNKQSAQLKTSKNKVARVRAKAIGKAKVVSSPESEYTYDKKHNAMRFFRANLQKSLLSRSEPPSDEDLKRSNNTLEKLEKFNEVTDVSVDLLRSSKLHKVLKAILKVPELERPDDFRFHIRSQAILNSWGPYLEELKQERITQSAAPPKSEDESKGTDIELNEERKIEVNGKIEHKANGEISKEVEVEGNAQNNEENKE